MNNPMRLYGFLVCCGLLLVMPGCGGEEATVVEAPALNEVEEEIPAMEGMSDEEYNKAMEEDMGG
ncbi:MAG: hypothetical protein AAGJ83_00505 [Planctomycetota bacterium]